MAYAENTSVPVTKSQAEIQDTVRRYGADGYVSGWQGDLAMIEFFANARRIRFVLEMPGKPSEFAKTAGGRSRTGHQAQAATEQELRRRWRALALVIKAKLEAVESGIVSFEDEFLAHIVMHDGRTVSEHVTPAIKEAYDKGRIGRSLLQLEGSS